MIWKTSELSEISEIGDGAHASLKRIKSGIPYLTAKNITKFGVDYTHMDYISEETYNKHFKEESNALTQPRKDDILYSIIGSIGGVYVVKDEKIGISSSVAIFRANSEVIIPQYLAYCFKSKSFDDQVQAIKGGVAQGFMSLGKLGTITIAYPNDIRYQKRLVDILYAYDELIENNQKQIKLLEEAAQRLYKEWFVDLRFPDYEKCVFVDGLPEGWKKIQLRDLGEIITGKTPSTANSSYYGGNIPFVKIPDMHAGIYTLTTEMKLTDVGANTQKNKFIPKNSIMVSCIGTAGLVNISCENCQTNQQINSIVLNNDYDLYYGYLSCKGLQDTLNALGSNGATMTNVNKEKFSNIVIVYPSKELLVKFNKYVKHFFEKIFVLSAQVIKILENRDRLLPKLMDGEIEV